jgi:D-alanine-D-alanine ligase-like ATP-grasp enzyme
MRVCVLQPDYADSTVEYRHFDPRRDLSALLPDSEVDHLFLRKTMVYRQLREAAARGYDIFVNLCEGYLEWDIPSLDVIWSLDLLGLPYTGPGTRLYDPSKPLMKYVAYTQGVRFPEFAEVSRLEDCESALGRLRFPMFVKPAHAGDSLGIDDASLVTSDVELRRKCADLLADYPKLLVEEYIDGREFTVLVAADPHDRFQPLALRPIEFVFPEGARYKTYLLKVEQHHPECNVPVADAELDERLRSAARDIFVGFEGEGYARLDFRMNEAGEVFFLDINFACSVFYPVGYEGSADYILKYDPAGASGFLRHIIAEGIERHRRRRRIFERRGNAIAGFGIYACEGIRAGQIVFRGEERSERLATLRHVDHTWPAAQREVFRRYALPLNGDVAVLWSADPEEWAPQNHSCDPNTAFEGLNLVALRDIRRGEELTLDYGTLCDETMMPFECRCGSLNCRGRIEGREGNRLGRK